MINGGYESSMVIEKHRIDSNSQGTLYTKGLTACIASSMTIVSVFNHAVNKLGLRRTCSAGSQQ